MAQSDGIDIVPEPKIEQCGSIAPHKPHDNVMMIVVLSHCPGVPKETEYRVHVHGIKAFSDLRDETAPLLRKMFPGVIVEVDERVIVSTMPPPVHPWRGASIDIYGAHWSLATSLEDHLHYEYEFIDPNHRDGLGRGLSILTDEERARVLEHRTTKRETT